MAVTLVAGALASAVEVIMSGSAHAFMSAMCPHRLTRFGSQRSPGVSFWRHVTALAATRGFIACLNSPQRIEAKLPHPPSMVGRPGPGQSPGVAVMSSHGGGGGVVATGGALTVALTETT